jgi:hypothetical protein
VAILTGQSFHVKVFSSHLAMISMSVTSFDWSELISSAVSIKKKWGMPHFATIASKSYRWALCHLSIPWRDADKQRVTLWANSEWVTLHGFSFGAEGGKDMPFETDSKCKKTLSSYSNKPKWIFLQINKNSLWHKHLHRTKRIDCRISQTTDVFVVTSNIEIKC